MKKKLFSLALLIFLGPKVLGQEHQKDTLQLQKSDVLEEIIVQSVRATSKTPIAFTNLEKVDIEKRNLGQDIPVLMNFMPSVVTTTDAGNGIGYTGIRVRGSDATRINVTLNGIPYNDSESHGTFWVNMPDFASSLQNLQLQRGVGTSTNGAGAFGASLNLLTDGYSYDANAEIANSYGSFESRKHTLKFSTGLLNNTFELQGRISKIYSDGYIDRAWSDMSSYFLQGTFLNKQSLFKVLTFGGKQQTYQAWNGIEDKNLLETDRTYNPSGKYTDTQGNTQFYSNETDNYDQDHYQLHWNEKWSNKWSTNLALHYTKGFGYFENYKSEADLEEYGLISTDIASSDLIRRKYLDNDFYGTTFSALYKTSAVEIHLGGAANRYKGKHYGEVLWVKEFVTHNFNETYYFDISEKNDINTYAKAIFNHNQWSFFGDLQYRTVHFKANGQETGNVNDTFHFFNPKAGVTYTIGGEQQTYLSYGKANREPNRNDYENGNPRPERLHNIEVGWRFANKKSNRIEANVFYMRYKDQLVLTGALNDVGAPLRENSGDSYRLGLEIDASVTINNKWRWMPTLTISTNKNLDFKAQIDGEMRNLGDTPIAFSPNFIASNALVFSPISNLQISWLTKMVGEQYMGNTKSEKSKLDSYFTNDLVFNYSIKPKKWMDSLNIHLMLNNIFNTKYISNGFYYTYDDNWSTEGKIKTIEGAGYYPQAQFNWLTGLTLKF